MGNQRFQVEVSGSVSFVLGKGKSYYLYLYATKQVSDNENVHHRQTEEGIPVSHPALPYTWRRRKDDKSFSQRLTTPSITARAAPTEMPIFCPVGQSLPRNTTALDLAASSPRKMAVSSSSGPAGFASVPLQSPVLVCVGWYPTPRALFWVDSLSPLRISAIFAHTGHVLGLTTSLLLLGDSSLV